MVLLPGNRVFLLFDTTHLFKNIYNDSRLRENFICMSLSAENESHTLLASFAHILFDLELGKAPKMAHKLCEWHINYVRKSLIPHPSRKRICS